MISFAASSTLSAEAPGFLRKMIFMAGTALVKTFQLSRPIYIIETAKEQAFSAPRYLCMKR